LCALAARDAPSIQPKRETQPYANTGARIAVIKSSLEQVESITGFNTELLIIESTVHRWRVIIIEFPQQITATETP